MLVEYYTVVSIDDVLLSETTSNVGRVTFDINNVSSFHEVLINTSVVSDVINDVYEENKYGLDNLSVVDSNNEDMYRLTAVTLQNGEMYLIFASYDSFYNVMKKQYSNNVLIDRYKKDN